MCRLDLLFALKRSHVNVDALWICKDRMSDCHKVHAWQLFQVVSSTPYCETATF